MKPFRSFITGQSLILTVLLLSLLLPAGQAVQAKEAAAPMATTQTSVVIATPSSGSNPYIGFGRWSRGGAAAGWNQVGFNDSGWSTSVEAGWAGAWNSGWSWITEIGQYALAYRDDGSTFYHRNTFNISIPAGYAIQKGTLQVFCDDSCNIWINGTAVSAGTVPAAVLHAGSNLIALQEFNSGWYSGMQYRLQVITYQVDTTPPTLGINGATPGVWRTTDATVTPNCTDASGINLQYVSKDNVNWVTSLAYTSTADVYVSCSDTAGNENSGKLGTIYVDKVSPTLGFSGATTSVWRNSNATITPSSTDSGSGIASQYVSADDATWVTSFTTHEGTNPIYCKATDVAGNVSSAQCGTVYVDTVAPTNPPLANITTSCGVASGQWNNTCSSPTFIWSGATDASSGVKGYDVYFGTSTTGTPETHVSEASYTPAAITTSGIYYLKIATVDNAGNQAEAAIEFTLKYDDLPAVLSYTVDTPDGKNGWYKTAPVNFAFSATDNGPAVSNVKNIYYLISPIGSPSTTWQTGADGSGSVSSTTSQSVVVSFYAVDYAGNRSATQSFPVHIDGSAPAATVDLSPTPNAVGWNNTSVDLTVTSSDDPLLDPSGIAVFQYRLNGGAWQDFANTTGNPPSGSISLASQGTTMVDIYLEDTAGNNATLTRTVKIDTTTPTLSDTLPEPTGANDWYQTSPILVTLDASDSGSGIDKIYYRDNNSAYQFVVGDKATVLLSNGLHTLDWYAQDVAGNVSETYTLNSKVDALAPSISTTLSDSTMMNGWYPQVENVTVAVRDEPTIDPQPAVKVEYQLNGSGWQDVSGPIPVDQDGANTLVIRATDDAGNATTKTLSFKIDSTTPVIDVRYPPADGTHDWYITPPTIKALFADADSGIASYSYTLDDGEPVISDTVTVSTSGQHTLVFTATDLAGHTYDYVNNFLYVDLTKPTLTVNVPQVDHAPSWYYADPVQVDAAASDTESDVTLTYSMDGSDYSPVNEPVSVSGEGKHLVSFRAINWAGQEITQDVPVWIATTVPEASAVMPGGANVDGWYNQPISLLSLTDLSDPSLTAIVYRLLPGGIFSSTPLDFKQSGVYPVEVKLAAASGLETTGTITIKVDLEKPTLQLDTPAPDGKNDWYLIGPVVPSAQGSDDMSGLASLCYSLDGGADICDGSSPKISEAGRHTIAWTVTDKADNTDTQYVSIHIDDTEPEMITDTPAPDGKDGWYIHAPVLLDAQATDSVSGLASLCYQLDSSPAVCDGSAASVTVNGKHTVIWTASDLAGNTVSGSIPVNLDATGPQIDLNVPAADGKNGWYIDTPIAFSAAMNDSDSGIDTFCYSLDGDMPVCGNSSLKVSDPGKHTITWTATDKAGNASSKETPANIDPTPPDLAVVAPAPDGKNGWFITKPETVGAKATDNESTVTLESQLNGGQWAVFTTSVSVETEGTNHLVIRATNEAGLEASKAFDFKIDTTLPSLIDILPAGVPTDGSWTAGPDGKGVTLPGEGQYPAGVAQIRYQLLPDGPWTLTPPALSMDGAYEINVEITDQAGNLITVTITIKIDISAPVITTNLNGAHNEIKDTVNLTGKVEDLYSGIRMVEISTDGKTWTPATVEEDGAFSYDYDTRQVGNNQHVDMQIRAFDQVGNQAVKTIGLDVNNEPADNTVHLYLPIVLR